MFAFAYPDPLQAICSSADHGWLRPAVTSTAKSRSPDIDAPINLSFRLRHLLGLVARAEVVRLLFTMQDSSATAAQLARSAGYTKRNVHEALPPLEQAGVITAVMAGNERRYWLDQQRWSAFLDTRGPSENVEWVPILLSMRRVLRWSRASRAADLADYLVASGARDLLDRIRPGLADAGIDVPSSRRSDASVEDLFSVVNRMFEVLDIA